MTPEERSKVFQNSCDRTVVVDKMSFEKKFDEKITNDCATSNTFRNCHLKLKLYVNLTHFCHLSRDSYQVDKMQVELPNLGTSS